MFEASPDNIALDGLVDGPLHRQWAQGNEVVIAARQNVEVLGGAALVNGTVRECGPDGVRFEPVSREDSTNRTGRHYGSRAAAQRNGTIETNLISAVDRRN